MKRQEFDVAIIGYGPTGLALASLLGGLGHRVLVAERWPHLYGLPRLTHIDGETARLLTFACDIEEALRDSSPIKSFVFYNGKGKPLLDVGAIPTLPMAHPAHISVHQPHIEDAIDKRVRTHPNVVVRQGTELNGLVEKADGVHLTLNTSCKKENVVARFVFGADGSRSFVREAIGVKRKDFGFNERWLNIDGERKRALASRFDETKQYCDPKRGHMLLPIGKTRQRFEFALLPSEDTAEMEKPEQAWKLLKEYHDVGPDDLKIIRQIVYTFECRLAEKWRVGSVIIGGDAVHTMPPYMGQGACSGIRDAANIAWKFDLVLRGKAKPELLDAYEVERRPQVTFILKNSKAFGAIANTRNRVAAFFRDQIFARKLVPTPPPFPGMPGGVIQRARKGKTGKQLGTVPPQGYVGLGGKRDRLDAFTGYRFAIIAKSNPAAMLSPDQLAFLAELDCKMFTLGGDAARHVQAVDDIDGVYAAYINQYRAHAMITRPDTTLFGFAEQATDLPRIVDELQETLHWTVTSKQAKVA